jgi:hypothetical protein
MTSQSVTTPPPWPPKAAMVKVMGRERFKPVGE